MAKRYNREKRGVLVFCFFAVVVMLIGIIMNYFNKRAVGGPVHGRGGGSADVNFSGTEVIWVGGIMLLLILFLYITTGKSSNANNK